MSDEKRESTFGADPPGTISIPEVTIQPYPTIKKGSRGPTVAKWQRMIGVDADGNFGSKTDTATRAWQKDHGLDPDGVVGIATWAKALETTSPAGMLALEWNQPSPEIPSPPAPPTVIPPTPGAMPITGGAVAVPQVSPKAPPKAIKADVGFMGWLGSLPTWLKGVLGIGALVAIASETSRAGKSGRGKHG